MSELWTDVIDPAELTGYTREAAEDYERSKGTLAVFLPNREVADIVARFVRGEAGLVPEANFRAYDAPPEVGARRGGKRVTLDLPALGQDIPVSEYVQLRARNASDEEIRNSILTTARQVVQAVSDRMERQRGVVLATGKATIDQWNFQSDDDFGRAPDLTQTAATLWTAGTSGRLEYLESLADLYEQHGNGRPGTMLMSRKVARLLRAGDDFTVNTVGSTGRPSNEQVNTILDDHGLPGITVYERKTFSGRVLPEDTILMLPAPVETNAWEQSELGATFWGRTLTSMSSDYGLVDAEQPGVVAGVYRNPKPPMIAEVVSDAIGLPVLANANLSLAAKVA